MSVGQPIRHAWRSLRRTPVFTITASLTLVIGVAAVVAIFAVLNGVLLRPLPYGEPDRLVGTWHDLPPLSLKKTNLTSGLYFTYQRLARTIESIGIYQEGAVNVAEPGGTSEPQRVTSAWITATLIPTLQVSPLLGRTFTDAEDIPNGPNLVIISEGMWRSRFGADRGRHRPHDRCERSFSGDRRRDAAEFPLSSCRDAALAPAAARSERGLLRRLQL